MPDPNAKMAQTMMRVPWQQTEVKVRLDVQNSSERDLYRVSLMGLPSGGLLSKCYPEWPSVGQAFGRGDNFLSSLKAIKVLLQQKNNKVSRKCLQNWRLVCGSSFLRDRHPELSDLAKRQPSSSPLTSGSNNSSSSPCTSSVGSTSKGTQVGLCISGLLFTLFRFKCFCHNCTLK